eukprot:XP_015578915.1 transcription factor HHO5-like [Ricinus communis]
MGSTFLDLSLSLKPSYVPKTIANFLKDLSKIDNLSDRLMLLNDYLQRHQEELSKVEAFRHQFPQCMLLLLNAIETLKREIMNIRNDARFEYREGPLMDFFSIKRKKYENMERTNSDIEEKKAFMGISSKLYERNHGDKKQNVTLQSWNFREGSNAISAANMFSTINNRTSSKRCDHQELAKSSDIGSMSLMFNDQPLNIQSKPMPVPIVKSCRRSWTPKLHAKFVQAIEYLGGVEVATPKQIKEAMKVEGLTNDQVKSHLQKYRLNSRRAPADSIRDPSFPSVCLEKFQDPCSWTSEFYHNQIKHWTRDPQELFSLDSNK